MNSASFLCICIVLHHFVTNKKIKKKKIKMKIQIQTEIQIKTQKSQGLVIPCDFNIIPVPQLIYIPRDFRNLSIP